MIRLIALVIVISSMTGPLLGQSGFFRSYNHAPWFSDGIHLARMSDSIMIGQSRVVDTTGNFGFFVAAYNMSTGDVLDSVSYLVYGESASVRTLAAEQGCISLIAIELSKPGNPVIQMVWRPKEKMVDTILLEQVEPYQGGADYRISSHGIMIYQAQEAEGSNNLKLHYDGVAWWYDPCGDLVEVDTLFRDTIAEVWRVYPNFSDPSKYLLQDINNSSLILLDSDVETSSFIKSMRYAENEFLSNVSYHNNSIVATRTVVYDAQGYSLFDETIAVHDDSLTLLWQGPLIPDRDELVPSYHWEFHEVHVDDDFITIVGCEDRGNKLPNSISPLNHLYATRYTVDGDLVWHRRYDAIDSLLPIYVMEDMDIDQDGNIYAYGYYFHSDPPPCDTCAVIRNTFLLKLDSNGYLNGPPTSTVEEVGAVDNGVSVYPNPATDHLSIISANRIGKVTVHSVDGQIVFATAAVDESSYSIDVSAYKPGLYMVTVMGVSGQVSTTKFVKY